MQACRVGVGVAMGADHTLDAMSPSDCGREDSLHSMHIEIGQRSPCFACTMPPAGRRYGQACQAMLPNGKVHAGLIYEEIP